MSKTCSQVIFESSRKFFNTKHWPVVEAAMTQYVRGDYQAVMEKLSTLPTDRQLMASLIEKCKGKPVYSNLRKILKNESVLKEDAEIAISSLTTRCLIESKDNREYRSLLPDLIAKLKELTK